MAQTTGRQAPPQGAALARQQQQTSSIQTLSDIIRSKAASFAAVAGKHLSPERLMKLAQTTLSRNPKLAECTPVSVVASLIRCAELGLEPGSLVGGMHLVPFKNTKTGKYECQPIIDYRGVIALVRRSGELKEINAYVVHKKDQFVYELGDNPHIEHKPYTPPDLTDEEIAALTDEKYAALMDPGPLRAVYMVARLKDGGIQREVMPRLEVEKIRRKSKAANDGPWVTHYDEMAKKTVVKRGAKLLPMATEAQNTLEEDRRIEEGEANVVDLTDLEQADALPAADTSSAVEKRLTAAAGGGGKEPPQDPPQEVTQEPAAEREPGQEG